MLFKFYFTSGRVPPLILAIAVIFYKRITFLMIRAETSYHISYATAIVAMKE